MIKVLLVDDHSLVRAGTARMLSDARGIHVIAEADCGEAALEAIKVHRPHVVLMDIRMPGIGGLEATRRALRIDPDLKIIALTVCDDEPFPTQLLRAGAVGYLSKGIAASELVLAIHRVYIGQRYVSGDIARQMALKPYGSDDACPFEVLSGREMQIALMVVNCVRVQEISERLHLSSKTVNSYRYRIFEKLNIGSDVELTWMAVQHGLVDTSRSAQASAA